MAFFNIKVSGFDLAKIQLERAIVLYLKDKDYVSALTLAGAAEEILGKILKEQGKKNAIDVIKEENKQMWEILGGNPPVEKSIVIHANFFRNFFKHLLNIGLKEITISVDYYSAEMLYRAIFNYEHIDPFGLPMIKEFKSACTYKNLEKSPYNNSLKGDVFGCAKAAP